MTRAIKATDECVAAGSSPARSGQPVLEDKLRIPQPSFPVLARPRVFSLLDAAVRCPVTLVSAPPGAGKTVACASWAAAAPGKVVWLLLDGADRLEWFWAYVCTGLKRAGAVPADKAALLTDCSPEAFPLCLVEVAQSLSEPVVMVLDDLHEITDPAVISGLDVLIRHAPPALRLVLSTRRPPELQLARLRIAGELADIGGRDLACTPEEARDYFAMLGLDLTPAARDEVLRRTEGWMAGLRLAAMRAQGEGRPGSGDLGATVTALAGDEPIVADYLWDEVLAAQTPATRSFLLKTSIVPELPGGLADALTRQHGGGAVLERLSRDNYFVEALDTGRDGYRYHPLLRGALAAGLAREIPEEIPGLLRRAAAWYVNQGRVLDGVRCAAQAGDWAYASTTLARSGLGVLSAGPGELESALGLFPADRATDDVAVAAAWAMARLWSEDLEGAQAYLDSAVRALPRAVPAVRRIAEPTLAALRILHMAERDGTGEDPARAGWVLAQRAGPGAGSQAEHRALGVLWFALGMSGLRRWEIGAACRALRHADLQLGAGGLPELRARTRAWRALAEACAGDLVNAVRAADDLRERVIDAAPSTSCLLPLADGQVCLARDDLGGADRMLAEAESLPPAHLPGEPPVAAVTALLRSRVWLADGDVAAARATLSRARGAWPSGSVPLSDAMTVAEADVALRAGDTGRARALLLLTEEEGEAVRTDVRIARADLLLAEGDFAGALAAVEPCLGDTAGAGPAAPGQADRTRQERIRALLVAAVARRRLGAADVAADMVERALCLAEPEGGYRAFLDGGSPVRSAVTVLVPPTSRYASFAARVREHFDAQGAHPAHPEHPDDVLLTDSERAVLCFLPSHMTNEEISQALYLSVNTVKTHLRSTYRKLGVASRREAIARGRRLGLL